MLLSVIVLHISYKISHAGPCMDQSDKKWPFPSFNRTDNNTNVDNIFLKNTPPLDLDLLNGDQ